MVRVGHRLADSWRATVDLGFGDDARLLTPNQQFRTSHLQETFNVRSHPGDRPILRRIPAPLVRIRRLERRHRRTQGGLRNRRK